MSRGKEPTLSRGTNGREKHLGRGEGGRREKTSNSLEGFEESAELRRLRYRVEENFHASPSSTENVVRLRSR